MKTSELIAAVGDDKVGVQFIDSCGIIRCGDFSDFAIYIASMAVVAVVLVGIGQKWW